MSEWRIEHGDCLDVMRSMRENSVDSIVTDPPYELGFMGKCWDASGVAYNVDLWREALRILKPGGHLLAFGGTRTYHRLACAIEDAGFEIRDSLDWIYGQGFPKSLDVSKAIDKWHGGEREVVGFDEDYARRNVNGKWGLGLSGNDNELVRSATKPITAPATEDAKRFDGWGTALKPAHEPIVLARKPLVGTVAANVLAHGTGGLNVDGCRVGDEVRVNEPAGNKPGGASLNMSVIGMPQDAEARETVGRWPPNLLLSHDPRCNGECAPGCPVAALDAQSGTLMSGKPSGRRNADSTTFGQVHGNGSDLTGYGDTGGASRFFPTFVWNEHDFDLFLYCAKASRRDRGGKMNTHPTVKPVALMRWLCRLVTPPGGIVLDPFLGSGTTILAALAEGFHCLGIEREESYVKIAEERIANFGRITDTAEIR